MLLFISLSIFIISACTGAAQSSKEGNYDTTKKMVVDIMQTDEGKKAFIELMADEKMKKELVIDSDVVKKSINDALASEKGKEMWAKLFKDPTFVEGFAKSMADEQKKLVKSLMNDAEFQKQLLELMHDPEMTKQMIQAMKSQKFRAHLEETIQHTLDSPLFQAKMTEVLLKAAEKQGKEKQQGKGGGQGGGGQGGGGHGGAGGGGASGGG